MSEVPTQAPAAVRTVTHCVLCGVPLGGLGQIERIAQGALPPGAQLVRKRRLSAVLQDPAFIEHGGVVSIADDILRLSRMLDQHPFLRVILVLGDPRDLLAAPDDRVPGTFALGFDHALHAAGNGIVTWSDPGLAHLGQVIRHMLKRQVTTLIVRHEDLAVDPEQVRLRVGDLVGGRLGPGLHHVEAKLRHDRLDACRPAWSPAQARRIVRQFRLCPALFDLMRAWGYARDRVWFEALSARHPEALDDTPGLVVGYYTAGTAYEAEARRLYASLARLNLPVALKSVEPSAWLSSVRLKPHVLLEQRRRFRGPLLYVDVDAVVHSDPWPYLRGYAGDVAVSGHRGQNVISGTILLNDTPGAQAFLQRWLDDQEANPQAWDQHSLEHVVVANLHGPAAREFTVEHLPVAMCKVFNRTYDPPVTPVIEHLQASRELRAATGSGRDMANLASRRARVGEIDGELGVESLAAWDREPGGPVDHRMFASVEASARADRTRSLQDLGQSDLARWSNPGNLLAAWAERARIAASLIEPPCRVLDLGCGRSDLEGLLRDAIVYQPSDLVRRDERTLVCDLNRGELPDVPADVVTMLGVLEYLHRPRDVLTALALRWPRLLVSYCPADLDGARDRGAHGWFNAWRSAELVGAADEAGFALAAIVPLDAGQRLYDLRSRRASA